MSETMLQLILYRDEVQELTEYIKALHMGLACLAGVAIVATVAFLYACARLLVLMGMLGM